MPADTDTWAGTALCTGEGPPSPASYAKCHGGQSPTHEYVPPSTPDAPRLAFEQVASELLDSPHYGEGWVPKRLDIGRPVVSVTAIESRDGAIATKWRTSSLGSRSLATSIPRATARP